MLPFWRRRHRTLLRVVAGAAHRDESFRVAWRVYELVSQPDICAVCSDDECAIDGAVPDRRVPPHLRVCHVCVSAVQSARCGDWKGARARRYIDTVTGI